MFAGVCQHLCLFAGSVSAQIFILTQEDLDNTIYGCDNKFVGTSVYMIWNIRQHCRVCASGIVCSTSVSICMIEVCQF